MSPKTSAQQLEGKTLDGGWTVLKRLDLRHITTGGTFSESYIVENSSGRQGFLKALDYSSAMRAPDPAVKLKAMTEAYLYERDLLYRCRDRNLDHVVMPIADGTIHIPGAADMGVVQYLIFEKGESDFRMFAAQSKALDLAWLLRALHHMAVGVRQLHSLKIAHQDLKPSNVVVFEKITSKVADLGRAAARDQSAPHDGYDVPGDPAYAPPELLYRAPDADWGRRRLGCDVYLMGSMVVFCFCGVGITSLVSTKLLPQHRAGNWTGNFTDVLPYLRDAFENAITDFSKVPPDTVREDLVMIVRHLCDPDPSRRGDPKGIATVDTQFLLDRYVTRLDLLARRAELILPRMAARVI
jgi:serine/threonine protein kinase